jgi:Flp pilus assembly protein TadB
MFAAVFGLSQTGGMNAVLPALFAALAGAALFLLWRLRRSGSSRQRAIRELLDAADALETRLRAAREEIEAIAGDQTDPVRGAMQEILRQRLWLQEHAHDASLEHLQAVRDSLEAARAKLEGQLQRVDAARLGTA